jgi:hypothetical protein
MDYCSHHKHLDLGYIQWHSEAARRINQKYTQVFCKQCERYLFPDELNEPDNPESIRITNLHETYLEEHPKAKPVRKI